ncbi:hypothetical protein GCM10011581_14250 [Saccharopolyspora subtropica]|uniref:Pentapeptide repeat protein n=1 Tax=Saccharopolyspora thermophila TaxID=89367 RepID=A0A917N8Q7_9PSEU|nr:hypothetical protein [Saccharopolyspora subtropica]GGI78299.1 hypothetical protein GCM10011581_14250 [Saccharopolyspora subtropica]
MDGCSLLGSSFVDCRLGAWVLGETDLTLVGMGRADLRGLDLRGIRFPRGARIDTVTALAFAAAHGLRVD